MYSSAVVIAVGLVNRDRHTPKYSLVLALIGAFIAINHVLEQKLPGFAVLPPCSNDVPCALDPMNAFGWLTIPMLALTAFVVIIASSLIALRASSNENNPLAEAPTSLFSPVPSVALVVLTIVALFGVTGAITRNRRLERESAFAILPTADRAARIYEASCQQCHGPANAGMQLIRTQYLKDKSDIVVMQMIQVGRAATAIDNVSGQAMPANGGRIGMTSEDVLALVKYLRQVKGL